MSVAEAVVNEVKTIEGEVVAEVAKMEAPVKAAIVEITAEEKLYLREAELEYLKATMEIQRFQKIVEEKAKSYPAYVESLLAKYGISKAEYVFDGAINAFKKL